ncbi:NAD-dependent epimerase/dehydratase family protein [Nocardioides sp. GXQ0305]|uniref:NAD-dependent epimerase/dehydratase family protein n=1 Tax=Nocardioides sp. GXQ0305 TaxID=3423912 RepID=UPI003D7E61E3
MRIAITGATGNVGTALLRRLTTSQEHELVGLARRLPEGDDGGVEWVAVDLTGGDDSVLREAFRGADAVVHLAWGFQPSHDTEYLARLGVGGTRRVLVAATATGVPHLVHMSSVGAYSPGPAVEPVDESWPTEGVAGSPYSRHKVRAERLLDAYERDDGPVTITRLRPGLIGQRGAAGALLRYAVPGFVPARALGLLPAIPLDRRLRVPMVHADDVAAAIELALRRRLGGAFNLAAEPPVTAVTIADALGARCVHVPASVLRRAASLAWRVRLQQVDPGWLDLAMQVPLLDTTRARNELGWAPEVPADAVLRETVAGLVRAEATGTPVLRPRTASGRLADLVRRGPVGNRRTP